uniref:L1 transposable element RRM domain-containing protein n=1 Tax=Oryzias latipes TaxID=8090 RepID=O93519_ORYLA|nr:unknown [Oryzias latipes]
MAEYNILLQELRAFRQENNEKLESVKEDIAKVNNRMEEAEGRIEKAEERIQTMEDVMVELMQVHVKLTDKLTDLESRERRENIRIYGVPETSERDSPSMSAFVETLLREGLKLEGAENINIERAHRSLGPPPPNGASPRSILVKFLSFKTKEQILRKAWQQKGFTWKGKQISLDNDYPPLILKKRREYAAILRILKDKQIQFQTLFPARLKVKYADGVKIYNTATEASEDMSKRGFPVEVIKPPESVLERYKQLNTWNRVTRGTGRTAPGPPGPSYKEKLRAFRRTGADPAVE